MTVNLNLNQSHHELAFQYQLVMDKQIKEAIDGLSSMKAPGPNRTGNVVFKQCQTMLTLHLCPIFCATLDTGHYPQSWKELKTIVLWKPNKQDYMTPKVYQPITLLDTLSKILSSCIAKTLTRASKQFSMLANHQFGVCPRRIMTDVHTLISFIKDI